MQLLSRGFLSLKQRVTKGRRAGSKDGLEVGWRAIFVPWRWFGR